MVTISEMLEILRKNFSMVFFASLLFIFPALATSPYQVVILTNMLIWGIFALSYDILLGQAGVLSFGHTVPFGVAAYLTAFLLTQGFPFIIALLVSIVMGAMSNLVIGLLCSKAKGVYYAILSLALAETLRISVENIANYMGTSPSVLTKLPPIIKSEYFFYLDLILAIILVVSGIIASLYIVLTRVKNLKNRIELSIRAVFYIILVMFLIYGAFLLIAKMDTLVERTTITVNLFYLSLILFLVTYLFAKIIVRSPLGSVWRAVRENPERAEALGYNILVYQLYALAISGGIAGVAGSLFSMTTIVNPTTAFSPFNTLMALLAVILGGTGTLIGPVMGAWIVQYLKLTLGSIPQLSILSMAILGLLYIIIILVFPYGIMGTWYYKGVKVRRMIRRMLKGRKI